MNVRAESNACNVRAESSACNTNAVLNTLGQSNACKCCTMNVRELALLFRLKAADQRRFNTNAALTPTPF
jgi:hypothetical protein